MSSGGSIFKIDSSRKKSKLFGKYDIPSQCNPKVGGHFKRHDESKLPKQILYSQIRERSRIKVGKNSSIRILSKEI